MHVAAPVRTSFLAVSCFLIVVSCGGLVTSSPSSDAPSSSSSTSGGGSTKGSILPECTPRAPPREGAYYGQEALPSGPCTSDEPECQMGAVGCPCGEHPYNGYRCACSSGTWACTLVSQGASMCTCDEGGPFDPPDGHVCSYPPVNNDPRCPASYSFTYAQSTCAPIGLTCAYPGQGDGTNDGCYATAMMWCRGDAGDADAGGVGTWVLAQ